MTSIEREEKEKFKKKERKQEEEETMQQATWVKYTFPIKHQVLFQHSSLVYWKSKLFGWIFTAFFKNAAISVQEYVMWL